MTMFRLTCALMPMLVFLEFPGAQGRRHSRRLRGQKASNGDALSQQGGSAYYDPGHYTKKQEFELLCRDELRSKAADGMLSQFEFAAFIFDFCSDDPQRGPACEEGLSFPSLAPQIQFNFVVGLCPVDGIQRLECLEFLNEQGRAFGYIEELEELCVSTAALLGSSGLLAFGDSTLVTLPSIGSEPTDTSTETDTDTDADADTDTEFEAPTDPSATIEREPSATIEREKTRKEKKEKIKSGTMMMSKSKKDKKDRTDSFEGIAIETPVAESSSMLSGDSPRHSSSPDPVDVPSTASTPASPPDPDSTSSTTSTPLSKDPFDLSPTSSTSSPPDPCSLSPTTSTPLPSDPLDISPLTSSTPNESANASEEGISIASRLGLSAAGFAVVILAVCSASKRRRTKSEIMSKDPALDGCESIISEESGVFEFAVQNGAALYANRQGGAGGGRTPWIAWSRLTTDYFKDPSRQQPQPHPRSSGGEMSENEVSKILWGSAVSSRGFFRRQSARIRRHVSNNRSNDEEATLEDDSTIECNEHTADNSVTQFGRKIESAQIAGGPKDYVGNEAEEITQPITRRAWRTKASRSFYSVFGVPNGDKHTEDPVNLNKETANFQEHFPNDEHSVQSSMSRSDWKRTLIESYDDETSLGSLAAVSSEVRKQFKEFDASLIRGFVDLDTRIDDSRTAPEAHAGDDDSVTSGQSLHLDALAKELAACNGEHIDRPRESDDYVEGSGHAPSTKSSPHTATDVTPTPSRPMWNNQANAVLVEDKPWRKAEGLRSTKIPKTATSLAQKFESPKLNPAINLASTKNPNEEEDGQKHVVDKPSHAMAELGHGEKSASAPLGLPSLPLEASGNGQISQQDDEALVDADDSKVSSCNGQSDDDAVVGVNARRDMFERLSHSSSPNVNALLAARCQDDK